MKTNTSYPTLRMMVALATLLLMANPDFCWGQLDSRYNLLRARVGLMNGEVIKGTIRSFEEDSLGIEDLKIAPPGSIVQLRYGARTLRATVIAVTDDYLLVTLADAPEPVRIPREKINYLTIKKSSLPKEQTRTFQQRWYHYSSIKYLALHKKGSGSVGMLVGLVSGATIGYLVGNSQKKEPQPGQLQIMVIDEETGYGMIFGLVGAGIGAAIGTTNNQMVINGEQAAFLESRAKIVKAKKNSTP